MRIKIMAPKSTAMKTAALKLNITNIPYSADIDLGSESSRVPPLNLELLKGISARKEPLEINTTNQPIMLGRRLDESNLCSSDQYVPINRNEDCQIINEHSESHFASVSNKSVGVLTENVNQQPRVICRSVNDINSRDIDSESLPPFRKVDETKFGCLFATAMLSEIAKKSKISPIDYLPTVENLDSDISPADTLYYKDKTRAYFNEQVDVICLDSEDSNIVSDSLPQVTDSKSEISADNVQYKKVKKSKSLAPNVNEQPDVICLELEDDDNVSNSLSQNEDSNGILPSDDLYYKKTIKSFVQSSNLIKKADVICLDFEGCNIVSKSLPWAKDSKSGILPPDDLRYKKIKTKQHPIRNSNEDLHVICIDSEDDDIASTSVQVQELISNVSTADALHYKKPKQGEVPASNLNDQPDATCMNLDIEDIDSNSLPPIYFSEKEAQEAKNYNLKFADFNNREYQTLSDCGHKSSTLAVSRQPEGEHQDFKGNDPETEHLHADNKKNETSESNFNEQSYIVCRQDIEDSQMKSMSKHVQGVKRKTLESNESNRLNRLRQDLEVDDTDFYKNEQTQKSKDLISTFNGRLNKECHDLKEHGEGSSLSSAYLIKKYETQKSYNVNSTKQLNVARKDLVHENLQSLFPPADASLCKRAKTSKVLKQNLTEQFNTNFTEHASQHEQASNLKRNQTIVNNDLGKLINDFSSTEKYSISKSMYSEKDNKNIASKQNSNQQTQDKEINCNNLQSDLILIAAPKIYSDSTEHFYQTQVQEAESISASKVDKVSDVRFQGPSTNGIKTLPKTSSLSHSRPKKENASFESLHNKADKFAFSRLNSSEPIKTMQEILPNDRTHTHRELSEDGSRLQSNKTKKSRALLPISTNLQTPNVVPQILEERLSEVLSADALLVKEVKKDEVPEPNFTEHPNFAQSNVNSNEVYLESSYKLVDNSHREISEEMKASSLISTEQFNVECQEKKLENYKSKRIPIVRCNEDQVQEVTRIPISKKGILSQSKKEISVKHKITKRHCLPNHAIDKGKNKLNSKAKKSKNLKSNLSEQRNVTFQALQVDSIDSNLLPRVNICSKASKLNESSGDLSDRPNVMAKELDLHNSMNNTATYHNTLSNSSTLTTNHGESTLEDRHTNGSVFLSKDAISNHLETNFKTLEASFDYPIEETSRCGVTISSQKLDEVLEQLKSLQEMVQRLTEAQKNSERREIEIMKELQALKNKAPEIRETWLVENDINLPMRSMDEYRRYCHLLENTSECRKILEAFIHYAVNGKQSLTRNIASVIRKYFAPELACQFTAVKPVKKKFVMAGTAFYNHLLNIFVQKSLSGVICKKLSESDFKKAFKEALCSSKDYYRNKPAKQTDQASCIM